MVLARFSTTMPRLWRFIRYARPQIFFQTGKRAIKGIVVFLVGKLLCSEVLDLSNLNDFIQSMAKRIYGKTIRELFNDFISELNPQSSHRKRMKTIENKGFLTAPNTMGWSVAVKTPTRFQKPNKINGFEHVSYGTALN